MCDIEQQPVVPLREHTMMFIIYTIIVMSLPDCAKMVPRQSLGSSLCRRAAPGRCAPAAPRGGRR
jgi:hypothetical protein